MKLARLSTGIAVTTLALCALAASANGTTATAPAPGPATAPAVVADEEAKGVLLVNFDREVNEFLRQAQAAIGHQDYEKGIELCHSLITGDRRAFCRLPEQRNRYLSARAAAQRLLGALPAEALATYCKQYDGPAGKLYEEAIRNGDEAMLRRLVDEFFQTKYGDKALNTLGAMAFDQGAFLSAGSAWERIYREHVTTKLDRAMLLAKAAVAYHLGGESSRARELLDLLKGDYMNATGVVGGQEVKLVGFTAQALSGPAAKGGSAVALGEWPAAYGTASALAVMSDVGTSVFPLWSRPEQPGQRLAQARAVAGLGEDGSGVKMALDNGRVSVAGQSIGQLHRSFALPALVHPAVLKDAVYCRSEEAVVAYDLATGKQLWQTENFSVHQGTARGQRSNPFAALAGDMGRYTLSVAEGKAFAVGRFRQMDPAMFRKYLLDGQPDSSTLAAISQSDGKILWEIGNGQGKTEMLRLAKYLHAPTYHNGRLYALVKYGNGYSALCLDARNGESIWEATIGPVATASSEAGSWQVAYTTELLTERGSPPTVADGRVYFTTNSGLVVALDSGSGHPVWTYQYDSSVSGAASDELARPVADRSYLLVASKRALRPQNPLIVASGRVICLPADSDLVMALNAADGTLLWQKDRGEQQDLSAIDSDRILLSGDDLRVMRASSGELLTKVDTDIVGRPAVTSEAVLGSALGRIVRLDLKTYALTEGPPMGEGAILGKLVIGGGRLVAASGAGVSVYADYDGAWAVLTKRLEAAAPGAARMELRLTRGQFALMAGRAEDAAAEFRAAEAEAAKVGDAAAVKRVAGWMYQTILKQAEATKDTPKADALLASASKYATTPSEQASLALRSVRFLDETGRGGEALKAAQAMSEKQAISEKQATAMVQYAQGEQEVSGYVAGQREVKRLLLRHGRGGYAAMDQSAQKAMDEGKAKGDVEMMLAAQRRWPHAKCAQTMLLSAGEMLYKQAMAKSPPDEAMLARASNVLGSLKNYGDTTAAAAGRVGAAIIVARSDPTSAGLSLAATRPSDPGAKIQFGDFAGTYADAEAKIAKLCESGMTPVPAMCNVRSGLRPAMSLLEGKPAVLRDARGKAVIAGDWVILAANEFVACLDTQVADARAAVMWRCAVGQRAKFGHLSANLRVLAVVDGQYIRGIDVLSGRTLYERKLTNLGAGNWSSVIGSADWVVFMGERGRLTCVNIVAGRIAWEDNSRGAVAMAAEGEMLLVTEKRTRVAHAFDLRKGVSVSVPVPRHEAEPVLLPDEVIATASVEGLVLFDPRRPKGVAWTARLVSAPAPRDPKAKPNPAHPPFDFVGGGGRFVATRDANDGTIRSVDLGAMAKNAVLESPRIGDSARAIQRVYFAGKRAYALCGSPQATTATGEPGMLAGPALAVYDAVTGKLLWAKDLATAPTGLWRVSTPEWRGNVIAVTLKGTGAAARPSPLLVGVDDGQITDLGSFIDANVQRLRGDAGTPVVVNGRVLVETEGGVILLESDL